MNKELSGIIRFWLSYLYTPLIPLKQVSYSIDIISLFEGERVWERGEAPLSVLLPLSDQERLSVITNESGRKGGKVRIHNQMQNLILIQSGRQEGIMLL